MIVIVPFCVAEFSYPSKPYCFYLGWKNHHCLSGMEAKSKALADLDANYCEYLLHYSNILIYCWDKESTESL